MNKTETQEWHRVAELGKLAIDYERQVSICGKTATDNILYFWVEGYISGQTSQQKVNIDSEKWQPVIDYVTSHELIYDGDRSRDLPKYAIELMQDADKFKEYASFHLQQAKHLETKLCTVTDEREVLIQAYDKIRAEFTGREWIMQGRGAYPYDDDRYKEEVRYIMNAFEEINKNVWAGIKSKTFEYREGIEKPLKQLIDIKEKEIERLRLKLAACGVAALSNTEETRKKNKLEESSDYWSASYQDVLNAVEREMRFRHQLSEALQVIEDIHTFEYEGTSPEKWAGEKLHELKGKQ